MAGAGAFCAATLITSPLDALKVRMQVKQQSSSSSSSLQLAWHMLAKEGATPFFAGIGPALLMTPAAVAQYTLMDPLRSRLPLYLAALIAGFIDITIKCPFDRLKTHRQGLSSGSQQSVCEFVSSELRERGIAGLWLGYGATLARDLPYLIIKWLVYAQSQAVLSALILGFPAQWGLEGAKNLIAGAIAGAVAAVAVTPVDCVKTQMQSRPHNPGALPLARAMYKEGGIGALFTGITPRLARIPLYTAVTLATFELIKSSFAAPLVLHAVKRDL